MLAIRWTRSPSRTDRDTCTRRFGPVPWDKVPSDPALVGEVWVCVVRLLLACGSSLGLDHRTDARAGKHEQEERQLPQVDILQLTTDMER